MQSSGFDFGLTVGAAFVRGIRDIGYRSTGTALDELVDNAIQAEARTVLIAFKLAPDTKRPCAIAVIDDGYGMSPTMCRLAAIWGGTHRETDRSGFGRYGYGLPSACVSQGRRFTIYSRQQGSPLSAVTLDIDAIAEGKYTAPGGRVVVPEPQRARLPGWVADHIQEHLPEGKFRHGTVVLIEELDRLTRVSAWGLERHLVDHFGVIYRNCLSGVVLKVQNTLVEPIDPLFLTPGARFFDLDADRAVALAPTEIPVRTEEDSRTIGSLTVRYAFFPPSFGSITKDRGATGRNANSRFPIMCDHNGIIVLRMGRQIDVVTRGLGSPFQNNDRYWKVEINFPPSLDEEFGITTSKQRIEVSSRIWDALRQGGVDQAVNQLRRMNAEARAAVGPQENGYLSDRLSERVMSSCVTTSIAQLAGDSPPSTPNGIPASSPAERGSDPKSSLTSDLVSRALVSHKVRLETLPDGPFFRAEHSDQSVTLFLNTAHPFFTELYAAPDSTYRLRSALEVILFALLGEANSAASLPEGALARWSERMIRPLRLLTRPSGLTNSRLPRDTDGTARSADRPRQDRIIPV